MNARAAESFRGTAEMSDHEYLAYLRRRLAVERVPYTGSIELTHRCNMRCVHCYLGDQQRIPGSRPHELDTRQWLDILDQAGAAGCLELLITGGEPLLRKDFLPIYRHAKEHGFIVTVFTNGTLIDDRAIECFADLPPILVEVSVYGATAATHERVTQVRGSFARCMRGIERLVENHVSVGLKTILMTLNEAEYEEMEGLARRLGAKWRLDSAICPCLPNPDSGGGPNRCTASEGSASATPLDLRLPPDRAVVLEMSNPDRVRVLVDTYERMKAVAPSDSLYTCGAGLTGFHVDPYGNLQPCIMTPGYGESVLEDGFAAAWRKLARIRETKAPATYPCNDCHMRSICSGCPAVFDLENGSPAARSEYICALTQLRFESIDGHKRSAQVHGN